MEKSTLNTMRMSSKMNKLHTNPNVGKSSILNSLLREDRAIVTHIPGTTRDIIEEVININGIPLLLVDTAGIRNTDDIVENIGVEKSKELINSADLILYVIDTSREIDEEDFRIYDIINTDKVIGILNKIDIKHRLTSSHCFSTYQPRFGCFRTRRVIGNPLG